MLVVPVLVGVAHDQPAADGGVDAGRYGVATVGRDHGVDPHLTAVDDDRDEPFDPTLERHGARHASPAARRVAERRHEAAEPVDEQNDPWQRVVTLVVRGEVFGVGVGEQAAPTEQLVEEDRQVAGDRFEVVAGGHVDHLRQRRQRSQAARGEVETEQHHLVRSPGRGGRHGDRAQHRRLAGTAGAEHEPAPRLLQVDERRVLVLAFGGIDHPDADHPPRVAVGRLGTRVGQDVVDGDELGEHFAPRPDRLGQRQRFGRPGDGGEHRIEMGRRSPPAARPIRPARPTSPTAPTAVGGGALGESSVCTNGATSTGCTVSSVVSVAPPNALWNASSELGPSRA